MPKTKKEQSDERWFGMRLTPMQKSKIERLADHKRTTQKDAVMEAVEHELQVEAPDEKFPFEIREGFFLEAAYDLAGSVEGPGDLSTNPRYMEGYGED